MKKTFSTPDGVITRELTVEEIDELAIFGDIHAKFELLKTVLPDKDFLKLSKTFSKLDNAKTVAQLKQVCDFMLRIIIYLLEREGLMEE